VLFILCQGDVSFDIYQWKLDDKNSKEKEENRDKNKEDYSKLLSMHNKYGKERYLYERGLVWDREHE